MQNSEHSLFFRPHDRAKNSGIALVSHANWGHGLPSLGADQNKQYDGMIAEGIGRNSDSPGL